MPCLLLTHTHDCFSAVRLSAPCASVPCPAPVSCVVTSVRSIWANDNTPAPSVIKALARRQPWRNTCVRFTQTLQNPVLFADVSLLWRKSCRLTKSKLDTYRGCSSNDGSPLPHSMWLSFNDDICIYGRLSNQWELGSIQPIFCSGFPLDVHLRICVSSWKWGAKTLLNDMNPLNFWLPTCEAIRICWTPTEKSLFENLIYIPSCVLIWLYMDSHFIETIYCNDHTYVNAIQTAKTLEAHQIRHPSDTSVLDWCLILVVLSSFVVLVLAACGTAAECSEIRTNHEKNTGSRGFIELYVFCWSNFV